MCLHVYICVCVCRDVYTGLDFRNEKSFAIFWKSRHNCHTIWQCDSQLGIIIRNLFVFLHPINKICLKRGNFV